MTIVTNTQTIPLKIVSHVKRHQMPTIHLFEMQANYAQVRNLEQLRLLRIINHPLLELRVRRLHLRLQVHLYLRDQRKRIPLRLQ